MKNIFFSYKIKTFCYWKLSSLFTGNINYLLVKCIDKCNNLKKSQIYFYFSINELPTNFNVSYHIRQCLLQIIYKIKYEKYEKIKIKKKSQ